jgi:hypothetical protein
MSSLLSFSKTCFEYLRPTLETSMHCILPCSSRKHAFHASETGVAVTLGWGSYKVTESTPIPTVGFPYATSYSEGCSGVIHPDETKDCTVTNVFQPF